jgi:hypothetical protein
MREQEKALIEAMRDSVFRIEVPFLTNAEVVKEVQAAAGLLGGPLGVKGAFQATTLKNWQNRGYFEPYKRVPGLRNQLFSTIDLISLVTIQHLVESFLTVEIAAHVATAVVNVLDDPLCDLNLKSDDHSLIFVSRPPKTRIIGDRPPSPYTDEFVINTPDFEQTRDRNVQSYARSKEIGSVLAINWKYIATIAVTCGERAWKEKADRFMKKLRREGNQ